MSDNISKNRCVLIGLPHSGKSSFIGALWHVVESGEIDNSYTVTTLPTNREYLNFLRDSWLGCKDLERSNVAIVQKISLNISNSDSSINSEFIFPDVSGEMYNTQFESRKMENQYLEMLESTTGIILFINPDYLKQPVLITDADFIIQEQASTGNSKAKPWVHKDTPTQVVLVDLLQMIVKYIMQ